MITVLTKLAAKDEVSSLKLNQLLKNLQVETHKEIGSLLYEVYQENNNSFYIFEKWQSQNDLNHHIELINRQGLSQIAMTLIEGSFENIILKKI